MAIPPRIANHEPPERLSREDWLSCSLKLLADGELLPLRIGELSAKLGVTKGSFYWHFEDRAEFIRHLAEHWIEAMSVASTRLADTRAGSACERLKHVMAVVWKERHGSYDLAMRSWALTEPVIAEAVRDVDAYRFDYISGLFREMGFSEVEGDHRSRLFYSFMVGIEVLSLEELRDRGQEFADSVCRVLCPAADQ